MSVKSFVELKKNCKKDKSNMPKKKFAILGDCSTQQLAVAIEGYAYEENIALEIFEADYNQISAQVMDTNSQLYLFQPDTTLIYMCVESLYEEYCKCNEKAKFADLVMDRIEDYWNRITNKLNTNILQFNFVEYDDRIYGNYGLKMVESFIYQITKLNYLLIERVVNRKNIFLLNLNDLQNRYGKDQINEPKNYFLAKMTLSMNILPEVAKQIIDVQKAIMGNVKKCVILDLDNTLWGGVIGDDGVGGIQIGELGSGRAFSLFQSWLKQLKNRGILLAVCSKNHEEIAKEPFEKNPEMILKLEDFAIFVANWDDKVTNIKYIQKSLNIGMDSLVFIDDNPFERELVKTMLPEVLVPELPEDPSRYVDYMQALNLFEVSSVSIEDRERTSQYQVEMKRKEYEEKCESYTDYLLNLNMKAEVCEFDVMNYPRIAQLTQRSNQFNLRTVRCTEEDIKSFAESDNYITLYFKLKDNFGEHGLISVVILEKQGKDTMFIHTWLMSCRVLKRTMEEFVMNKIVEKARELGYKQIIGQYIETNKNKLVKDIYKKMGLTEFKDGWYSISVKDYIMQSNFIEEIG